MAKFGWGMVAQVMLQPPRWLFLAPSLSASVLSPTLLLMIVGCTRPSPVETSGSDPRRVLEHAVQPGLALGQEVLVGAYASKFGVSSGFVLPLEM